MGLLSRLKTSWFSMSMSEKKIAPESKTGQGGDGGDGAGGAKAAADEKTADGSKKNGGTNPGNSKLEMLKNPRQVITGCMNTSLAVDTSKPSHYRVRKKLELHPLFGTGKDSLGI